MLKSSISLIRKNDGPRRRLPEKQDFPLGISSCKIVKLGSRGTEIYLWDLPNWNSGFSWCSGYSGRGYFRGYPVRALTIKKFMAILHDVNMKDPDLRELWKSTMIFLRRSRVCKLPDFSSQSLREKLGFLKSDLSTIWIDRLWARFKAKNTYVDEVIQQAVKKNRTCDWTSENSDRVSRGGEDRAIQLFSENLRNLLLIPPKRARGPWIWPNFSDRCQISGYR